MRSVVLSIALSAVFAFAARGEAPIKIVALGDSLTAGYMLAPGSGFVDQLQSALDGRGYHVTVVDAGVSGDTTSGGRARLEWSVPPDADAVILELGANDALRGLPPATTRANLDAILTRLNERHVAVLVAGMLAPPNLGEAYGRAFNAIFADLAAEHDALLYPFFLEGVAADPALSLADGMHPNAAGIDVIVANILPSVEALIARVRASDS